VANRHTFVLLLQDRPGTLERLIGLCRRRGFPIESLSISQSETPRVNRITIVVQTENVEKVRQHCFRLIEVISVTDVTHEAKVERELLLTRVQTTPTNRAQVVEVAHFYGARVVDIGEQTILVELTDVPAKISHFVEMLRRFGIVEMSRTGRTAMLREAQPTRPEREVTRPDSRHTLVENGALVKRTMVGD
jgi:acetolactate synthase-1/3 small subunit